MPLIKHEFPILERDTEQQAVIMPNRGDALPLPKKAVMPFLDREYEQYVSEHDCEKLGVFETCTKTFPIYQVNRNGQEITLCQAPLGAPAVVQFMEFLIGHGVREIVAVGCCGALVPFPENEILIPTEAVRDEGTSYHYLPPARTVKLNRNAVEAIKRSLDAKCFRNAFCKTWTTDGFYRETTDLVRYRISEGCEVVDMECAAMAACAQFRGVTFGQILYTADTLEKPDAYDERNWGKDTAEIALQLALDAVCEL